MSHQCHMAFFLTACLMGHDAMPGTKKMPDLELILKVVMPSDPTFHFRNYVYIRLIVTKLGILKGVTSHSHTITNINCKCSLNMYLAHYTTDLLHSTCKITLQKQAITEVLVIKKGTRQEVSEKVLEGRKGCNYIRELTLL